MFVRPVAQSRFTSASEAGKQHLEELVIDLFPRICCSSVRLLCRVGLATMVEIPSALREG